MIISPVSGYELDMISAHKTGDQSTVVTLSGSGATRTFTMPAYGVTVTATFIKSQATLDSEALTAIKVAIEGGTYRIAQATGNMENDVKIWLVNTLNTLFGQSHSVQFRSAMLSTVGDVKITTLTPATAGTEGNPEGVNGSFKFTVDLFKGEIELTTSEVSGIIIATPYIETPVKNIELMQLSNFIIRITNTGNIVTGNLNLVLSGENADVFTLSATTLNGLTIGEEVYITLTPRDNLVQGTYTAILTVSGEGLESKSIEIIHNVTDSDIDDVVANQLSIFPNPAQNDIFIKSNLSIEKVEIYSLSGELLMQENNFNEKISVSVLLRGVYLLKIYTDKGLVVSKIVKE